MISAAGLAVLAHAIGAPAFRVLVEPRRKRIKRLRSPTSSAIATNWPGPGQDFALEDRKRVRHSFLANADPLGADVSP